MVYIVYIKHNNMEMKKKKKVLVLYPSGNYLYPTTGGELYDSYLFKRILFSGQIDMSFFTKDHTRRINKWLLPAYILWSCRRIGSYDAVFLNSGWFAQSIWLLYFFRICYSSSFSVPRNVWNKKTITVHVGMAGIGCVFRYYNSQSIYAFLDKADETR